MPASACQNLYILRWTLIYIRLLLLFKNPPSPSLVFLQVLYSVYNDTVKKEGSKISKYDHRGRGRVARRVRATARPLKVVAWILPKAS